MNRTQFVREVVLHNPLLIPSIMKDNSYDSKITKGIMYKMIPFRSSLEIEANGSLLYTSIEDRNSYVTNKDYDQRFYEKAKKNKLIINKYKIYSYDEEYLDLKSRTEFKISIKNFTQIKGLYLILNDLKKNASLNMQSGIHIHIDYSQYTRDFSMKFFYILKEVILKKYYKGDLETIVGPYKGTYNCDTVDINYKKAQINIRPDLNSIEFRTVPMTFEYEEIIQYIIGLNKFVKDTFKNVKKMFSYDNRLNV